MMIEDAVRFLSGIPPFQFLEPKLIREVAESLTLAFFPAGTEMTPQDNPAGGSLRIIKKGVVKITFRANSGGDETIVDYREAGETFGLVSLMAGQQWTTIVAAQDTICYLLPRDRLNELLGAHPSVMEYLVQFHLTKYVDMTSREIRGKSMFLGSSDHVLFTTRVGEIAMTAPATAPPDATIQEAAKLMVRSGQSAVLVVDIAGSPAGILTDSDLRAKVVATGCPFSVPVSAVMTSPVVTVDASEHCFEVILRMLQNNIHHVAVTRGGLLQGVITNQDFMVLQGRSPLAFSEDIALQRTIEGLAPVSKRALSVIGVLLREGARAQNIIRIISELNDRIVRKVIRLTEEQLGPPPAAYAWLAMGSEGRKEQTFRTDQDNALVYADPAEGDRPEVADYFRRFAILMRDGLMQCGFEACPAGYMASTPEWCQPLSVWKRYFSDWVADPRPEALLRSVIFFDFRALAGQESLANDLREHLIQEVPRYPTFLGFLANLLIRNRPPLGFFGNVISDRGSDPKDGLNLKIKGIAPLVDIARLFALEHGIRHSSTVERIQALRSSHSVVAENADELDYAFEFISLLRIHHQYHQMESGLPINNMLNLDTLSNLERQSLKNAFRLITKIQGSVMERYRGFIV